MRLDAADGTQVFRCLLILGNVQNRPPHKNPEIKAVCKPYFPIVTQAIGQSLHTPYTAASACEIALATAAEHFHACFFFGRPQSCFSSGRTCLFREYHSSARALCCSVASYTDGLLNQLLWREWFKSNRSINQSVNQIMNQPPQVQLRGGRIHRGSLHVGGPKLRRRRFQHPSGRRHGRR